MSDGERSPSAKPAPVESDSWTFETRDFEEFVAIYRPYLKSLAETSLPASLKGRLDGSDLVQETLLKGFRQIHEFQGTTEAELLAWLKGILDNHLIDTHRFHSRQCRDVRREEVLSSQPADDSDSTPSGILRRKEADELVRKRLQELPQDLQTVLLLRHKEGLTFPEIGEKMGRSADAVRMLWGRATVKLGELLAADEPTQ